ncbi:MAG: glycosyltransferase [Candidatus Sungbacteria bacterium]|nr:glycosyltransferase [Candidatus Sungbacteria bacterium]
MKNPLISVIIPTHNAGATIGVAIRSIIEQTYQNLEIIVVDDNSTDATYDAVTRFTDVHPNIAYYRLPYQDPHRFNKRGRNINAGYSARNFGFEKVHGQWITFQDADDASLRNRIEVQYALACQYDMWHVCVDWQQFDETMLGKMLDTEAIFHDYKDTTVSSKEITALAAQTKGLLPRMGSVHRFIPFSIKTMRVANKLFFSSLESYPGTGNSPLFRKEVIEKVRFRALPERVWPSFTGRGADRDFNFAVAEAFGRSMVCKLPLYLWRVNRQNPPYADYGRYLHS